MASPFLEFLETQPAAAYYSSPGIMAFMAGMSPAAYQAIPMDARATQAPASQARVGGHTRTSSRMFTTITLGLLELKSGEELPLR